MNIAIAEDVREDREHLIGLLKSFLSKFDFNVNIREFESGEALLSACEPEVFDLCFMDIYLNGIDGMETARRLRTIDVGCMVIFLTSSDKYIGEGYKISALRYLLKPVTVEMLKEVLPLCVERIELSRRRLSVTAGKKEYDVPFNKILYVITAGTAIELHFADTYITLAARSSFNKTVEPLLSDYRFITGGRGLVINMAHTRALAANCMIMDNGDRIPISRRLMPEVSEAFMHFQFEYVL